MWYSFAKKPHHHTPQPINFFCYPYPYHSRSAANSIGLCWDWREETGQIPPCGLEHKALTLLAIRLLTILTLRLLKKLSHFYFCKLTRGYTLTSGYCQSFHQAILTNLVQSLVTCYSQISHTPFYQVTHKAKVTHRHAHSLSVGYSQGSHTPCPSCYF